MAGRKVEKCFQVQVFRHLDHLLNSMALRHALTTAFCNYMADQLLQILKHKNYLEA